MRIVTIILMVLILVAVLGGCASSSAVSLSSQQTQQAIAAGRPAISPQNLTCKSEPRSPGGDATDNQAATFVLDLAAAGRDCRSKLQAVRETLAEDR